MYLRRLRGGLRTARNQLEGWAASRRELEQDEAELQVGCGDSLEGRKSGG